MITRDPAYRSINTHNLVGRSTQVLSLRRELVAAYTHEWCDTYSSKKTRAYVDIGDGFGLCSSCILGNPMLHKIGRSAGCAVNLGSFSTQASSIHVSAGLELTGLSGLVRRSPDIHTQTSI
jgi:hypothetical protein